MRRSRAFHAERTLAVIELLTLFDEGFLIEFLTFLGHGRSPLAANHPSPQNAAPSMSERPGGVRDEAARLLAPHRSAALPDMTAGPPFRSPMTLS